MFASNREGTDPTQQYQETVFIINISSFLSSSTNIIYRTEKSGNIPIVYVVTREVHYFGTIKNIADIFVAIVHNRLYV